MPPRHLSRFGGSAAPSNPRPRAVVSEAEYDSVCEHGFAFDAQGIAIGQCGCAGGGVAAPAAQYVRGGGVMPGVAGVPTSAQVAQARAAAAAANQAAAAAEAAAAAGGDWTVGLRPNPGCYPRSMAGSLEGMGNMLAGYAGNPAPYSDPVWDFCNMDSLYSDITTVAAGATVNIPTAPNQGTFGAFYWDVLAVDDATGVEVDDYQVDQPFVQGCPTPCDVNGPILAQYVVSTPDQCCGKPFRAFLDEESRNAPLNLEFTNNSGGVMRVQVRVRGYCCSSKVCW